MHLVRAGNMVVLGQQTLQSVGQTAGDGVGGEGAGLETDCPLRDPAYEGEEIETRLDLS